MKAFWRSIVQFLEQIFTQSKAAPPASPVVKPPVTPAQPSPPTSPVQLAQAILAYNNGLAIFANGATTYTNDLKGVVVHKLTSFDAGTVATIVKQNANNHPNLPETFILGCLAIESTFDPLCQNGNFEGSNPTKAEDGYDVGIAQLKLKYLISASIPTVDAARAFAVNMSTAIPHHCKLMETNLAAAKALIANNTSSVPDARLRNPLLLATGIYNFGPAGMTAIYNSGEFPTHCQQVLDLERHFAKTLGIQSCFSDIAG